MTRLSFLRQQLLIAISILVSAFLLTGCWGSGGFESVSNVVKRVVERAPPCNPGFCHSTPTADKVALEAKPFEFDFTPTNIGTELYVSNKPSWLQLDKNNTKIYGTPDAAGLVQNIEIYIYDGTNTEIIGPFAIQVSGDPFAAQAWHMRNVGQKSFASQSGTSGEDINVLGALAQGMTGLGVKIAISDSGVEIAHEDLTDNVIPGASRNYDLASPYIGDPTPPGAGEGHGTAVTGLAVARGWNNKGSRGVAPEAMFAGFYFIGSSQSLPTILHQANGNFDIFNYSYGYSQCVVNDIEPTYADQLKFGATTLRGGLGALYVQAGGNEFASDLSDCVSSLNPGEEFYFGNANLDGNMTTPYTVVVGALNAKGLRASYSSPGANLWVSAPGGEFGTTNPAMLTTDLSNCSRGQSRSTSTANAFQKGGGGNSNCNYTSTMNGTSSAAPVTSGVIALILDANPSLKWRDVKHILATSATQVNASAGLSDHPFYTPDVSGVTYQQGWVTNVAGYKFHNWYGFGRVNAGAAVTAAMNYGASLPALVETSSPFDRAWYYSSGAVNINIPDVSATGITSTLNVRHNLVVESVQVKLNITHTFPSDLSVELISPSGTKSILLNYDSVILDENFVNTIVLSNAFYGESSRGNWQLRIFDVESNDVGKLDSWEIKVFGHVSPTPAETLAPSPVSGITVPAVHSSLTTSPLATWSASPSGDVIRYEFSIGTSAGASNIAGWQSVGGSLSANEMGLTLTDGTTYFFNVRAVDTSENISTVVSDSWVANVP